MKFKIYVRSNKNFHITPNNEYLDTTFTIDAKDLKAAAAYVASEPFSSKIDSAYLPVIIQIKQQT